MYNFKYYKYTFNINKYKNYKKNLIYKEFQLFKEIKYDGIKILNQGTYSVTYKIDNQLLRKLKISNINNNINNDEKLIFYFIEKSIEIEKESAIAPNSWFPYSYSNFYVDEDKEEEEIKKEQHKNNLKFQSKNYSQKVKIYENKGRLRK